MKTVLAILACLIFSCVQAQEVLPLYNEQIPGNISENDKEKTEKHEKGKQSLS